MSSGESPGAGTGSALGSGRRIDMVSCSLALDSDSLAAAATFVSAVTSGRPALSQAWQHLPDSSVGPLAGNGVSGSGGNSSSPSSAAISRLRLKLSQLTVGVKVNGGDISSGLGFSAADFEYSSFSTVTQQARFLYHGKRPQTLHL